ncbi:MAG: hypothetical protein K0R18_1446 [Bacillales bacterium]|jgi:hypothetical protein|nr:hypothetical protein [Bacillales bacterium]
MGKGRKIHVIDVLSSNETYENRDPNHSSSQIQQSSEAVKQNNKKRKKNQ